MEQLINEVTTIVASLRDVESRRQDHNICTMPWLLQIKRKKGATGRAHEGHIHTEDDQAKIDKMSNGC